MAKRVEHEDQESPRAGRGAAYTSREGGRHEGAHKIRPFCLQEPRHSHRKRDLLTRACGAERSARSHIAVYVCQFD